MPLRRQTLTLTTDSSGAGTATSPEPINGYIDEIRNPSAVWGGTADYTVTRSFDGGTVWQSNNVAGPFQIYPRGQATPAGTAIGGTAIAPIPVEGYLQFVVSGSTGSLAGTVHIYYEGL